MQLRLRLKNKKEVNKKRMNIKRLKKKRKKIPAVLGPLIIKKKITRPKNI
jgi:hypothetical protein